ncbi:hypothetical protein AB1Y20_000270 [Prymnesium parvum]|uniref:Uncharacterized protein n=1 Tax=Prymnesium parvum TaxID=97485 RepID=A0AB34K8L3_PRYPA
MEMARRSGVASTSAAQRHTEQSAARRGRAACCSGVAGGVSGSAMVLGDACVAAVALQPCGGGEWLGGRSSSAEGERGVAAAGLACRSRTMTSASLSTADCSQ